MLARSMLMALDSSARTGERRTTWLTRSGQTGRLDGKVAIVTGGGGNNSIGRAISLRYGREGARVAVLDINAEGAAKWPAR